MPKGKILLVDDSPYMRKRVAKLLEQEGYTIFHASNGEEALTVYGRKEPDLVFMDITMPVMDGLKCVKKMMQLDANARIVMLSAIGEKNKVIEAINSGAMYFLVKPFDGKKVMEAIQKFLPFDLQ